MQPDPGDLVTLPVDHDRAPGQFPADRETLYRHLLALAGGAEATVTPMTIAGFSAMKAMSTSLKSWWNRK